VLPYLSPGFQPEGGGGGAMEGGGPGIGPRALPRTPAARADATRERRGLHFPSRWPTLRGLASHLRTYGIEMHPNEELIHRFYDRFQARDADGMVACYHPEVTFRDAAFGELDAGQVDGMWHLLCSRATDLEVSCSYVHADDREGSADWRALYTFGQTGRRVDNRIAARFQFRDGLIVRHEDDFSFRRWSRQALGPVGLLLGWTPLLQNRVRSTARRQLARYMRQRAEASGTAAPAAAE